jgi:hypothetical protein
VILRRGFRNLRFPESVLRSAISALLQLSGVDGTKGFSFLELSVTVNGDHWDFDSLEEFFGEYHRSGTATLHLVVDNTRGSLVVTLYTDQTRVSVSSKVRHDVLSIMNIFQQAVPLAIPIRVEVPQTPVPQTADPGFKIFIGHGHSREWEKLKNHLQDKHGLDVVSFETGSRVGHQVRDILEEMLEKSSLALIVFTGEDEMADGEARARQNVVHEAGLFQGRLGFSRAIILRERNVEGLSNLDGIQYIGFDKDSIEATFGDVIAVINREMERSAH